MAEKIHYSAYDINFSPLSAEDYDNLQQFSCGVKEIDQFFHHEVALCAKYHYLSPYKCTLVESNKIVGLFTLANDVISLETQDIVDFQDIDSEYEEIFRHQTSYPAVNIGHLAVLKELQSKGLGQIIVEFITATYSRYTASGCQFVTVDALNNARTLRFYQDKLGFELQTLNDLTKPTRRMYLFLTV